MTAEPAAFLRKMGSPPTLRNARTGELTPPGMYLQASWYKLNIDLLVYWKNWPAAVFRTSATFPPAKGATFAGCLVVPHASQVRQAPRLKMTSRPPPFRLLAVAEPPWAFMTSD